MTISSSYRALLGLALLATARAEPATEAQLLKEVKAPDGFDVTLFAQPPMMNYPVFVAAAPDGTIYVSSDGNGSLGRDPHRGRILRLRDTDGDGRADEVKTFVADVDSPRGLVWDHDRLYVIHPPHLSCYTDADGDGVAEKTNLVVKNCGFTFKDRPADHTTNGLELGPDGWLYVTQGDFGFLEAEGADGRKLQFRGGGIWRVRPDGTGLEMYAYGTRNIVEAGVSPLLDIFARDNTNDGGGWDVRFHHFTGLEDHGYPKLFMNFSDEIVPRLADYGGGSGCGGCFIDEPGFPAGYCPSHFSADWGHGTIYRHPMTVKGATFSVGQEPFIHITRATDLDVDAFSHVYACSWRGAVFNWAGPDVGFIARVTPKGFHAEPLPDFAHASDADLVKILLSPSARRRLEAQRTLIRRGLKPDVCKVLFALAREPGQPLASRVAAVFALKQGLGAQAEPALARLAQETPTIQAWALRALTDREDQLANVPSEPLVAGTKSADPRARREAAVSLARLGKLENAPALVPLLGDEDVVIAHTAVKALVRLHGFAAGFGVVDRKDAALLQRTNALRALQQMHETAVVDGLIARLGRETDPGRRGGLITALCRLARVEGVWKGDSWGTRPDTRGPYYQPEPWAETEKIEKVLSDALARAQGDEAGFLLAEFARHRINPGDASSKVIELAAHNEALVPTAVAALANAGGPPPASAVPMLIKAAAGTNDKARVQAMIVLTKAGSVDAFKALLVALPRLEDVKGLDKEVAQARNGFFNAPQLDQHVDLFVESASRLAGPSSVWAEAALLELASRKIGSPEPREAAAKALETAWADARRRAQILKAAELDQNHYDDGKFVAALTDSDPAVAAAARSAVAQLKIDPEKVKAAALRPAAKIMDMKTEDVLAAVMTTHGDPARGPQLFLQQACVACHTTKKDEPPKGPYLGNIATIYKRRELAENILMPNKSIAMGFATHVITLKNGTVQTGFVVQEAADAVTIRTIAAQEIRIPVGDIAKREKMEKSIMPEQLVAGLTVQDFASLLDYLEQLAKQP